MFRERSGKRQARKCQNCLLIARLQADAKRRLALMLADYNGNPQTAVSAIVGPVMIFMPDRDSPLTSILAYRLG